MIVNDLEEKVSHKNEISDITNLSDQELENLIEGKDNKTTSEQLREARIRVQNANKQTKSDYLQGQVGIKRKIGSILYSMNIQSPEKELDRKNNYLIKLRTELDSDIKTVKQVVKVGHKDIIDSEKRKLAIDVMISRKEKALEEHRNNYENVSSILTDESANAIEISQLECELQESDLSIFSLKGEIKSLTAEYVLTHNKSERIQNVMHAQELEYQKLVETRYDLEAEIQEINLLMKRGVSPMKILGNMEKTYSMVEQCERIKNNLSKSSYNVGEAISDIKIVAGVVAEENQSIYRKNKNLANKNSDRFELEYRIIKENKKK